MTELQDFFLKHINIIKRDNHSCKECGDNLIGDFSEVAHILPKSKFKSIAMNDDNVIYLCGRHSKNNCHAKFDNYSISAIKEMNIYPSVQKSFSSLEGIIQEKLTWKDYDRFEE